MPSRLKTKNLHESSSYRGHFLPILQSKLLTKVTVGSHREWYHQLVWALMHGILCALPKVTRVVPSTWLWHCKAIQKKVYPNWDSYTFKVKLLAHLPRLWGVSSTVNGPLWHMCTTYWRNQRLVRLGQRCHNDWWCYSDTSIIVYRFLQSQ